MKRVISALLLLVAWPAWSACTGSNPTWISTPDQASVQACVTSAATGSTINVSSGSATWSSGIAIPAAKDLSIIGAGIGNTTLTCSGSWCFDLGSGGASSASRISGFSVIDTGADDNTGPIDTEQLQTSKTFRVDHCSFQTASLKVWYITGYFTNGPPNGLFDHNQFTGYRFILSSTDYRGGAEYVEQSAVWNRPLLLGGADAIYFEDNTFTITGTPQPFDGNYGGAAVLRFNTFNLISTYFLEWHGVQGTNRGPRRLEIYNNTINNFTWTPVDWRGGTGVFFNNTTTGNNAGGIVLELERACLTESGSGLCDGTSAWDGNRAGQAGYPCRDQIGRGRDTSLYTGGAWPSQELNPIYIFNSTLNGNAMTVDNTTNSCPAEPAKAAANRDFYVGGIVAQTSPTSPFNGTSGVGFGTLANRPTTCTPTPQAQDAGFGGVGYWATDVGEWNSSHAGADGQLYTCSATNTWTLYYKPYTYPHPLQGGTVIKPTPPTDIIISKLIH